MSVALVDYQANTETSASATFDVSYTAPSSGDDMVLIALHHCSGPGDDPVSVTYDPGGGDQASFEQIAISTSPHNMDDAVYVLKEVDIVKGGTRTIRFTADGSTRHATIIACFTGVDQTTPYDTAVVDTGENGNGTDVNAISTETGDLVVAFCTIEGTELGTVPDSPLAELDASLPIDLGVVDDTISAGSATHSSSVNCSFSWDASTQEWITIQFNINQVSTGGVENDKTVNSAANLQTSLLLNRLRDRVIQQ